MSSRDTSFKYVGRTFPCDDALRKVTGDLVFGSDMKLPNMLHARLLLSSVAHGLVKRIDTARAERVPGVVKVFTHLDTPATKFNRYVHVAGSHYGPADETLLAREVKFAGDRVAAVVATSLEAAREAVSLIEVDYEELPALLTTEEALGSSEVKIHPSGNLIHQYDFELGEKRPPGEDCIIVESQTQTQLIHHAAIEPHLCLAQYDSSGKLTVWTPTQSVFGVRNLLSEFFGISCSNVRVIKLSMGGSFGGKQEFIIEPLTAFLSMAVRRPVKLMLTREECIIATNARAAKKTIISTGVTGSGELLDFTADSTLDAGAYVGNSIDYAYALSKVVNRLYSIPRYRHRCRVVYTNKVVTGGARGWGSPEIITATEVHMDKVARALHMDPVEFRLKNLVRPYDTDPASGISLGDARIAECLERGAQAFDWPARYNGERDRGRYRRGVGVACGAHKNGMYGGALDCTSMILRMNEDGSLILTASLHDVGCGAATSMSIIVAEVLGVDPGLITVTRTDTENTPYDPGCYSSRTTYNAGACARQTAEKLKEKLKECAAFILQKPREYLVAEGGRVFIKGKDGRSLTYREIAAAALRNYTDLLVSHTYNADSNPGAYSAQFAGVEVDTCTGLVRVTDFLAVGDVGRAINRGMVEGQFQGAAQMGIGYALCEEIKVNARGLPVNNSFKKYNLVNAPDMPDVGVLLIEHDGDSGPFGAKSVGEIAAVPAAAAVINAVNNALGTALSDMPLTQEKILSALKGLKNMAKGENDADRV